MTQKATKTIRGAIVAASPVTDFTTRSGKVRQGAYLHIKNQESEAEVAVRVTGDMVGWVGCIGMKVTAEFAVRVFTFTKEGRQSLGNDVYAISIKT